MRNPDRPRSGILAILLALIFTNLAVWAGAETQPSAPAAVSDSAKAARAVAFAANTRVMLLWPGVGQWTATTFDRAQPGNEFLYNNQLYHVIDAKSAEPVLHVSTAQLFEADRAHDETSRKPRADDVVQVVDAQMRPASHATLGSVAAGTVVRFQGKAYKVKEGGCLVATGMVYAPSARSLQKIEITASAWSHVIDRHTAGGSKNADTSVFGPAEDIKSLIKAAEIAVPVPEANGYTKRLFDAGRIIGYYPSSGKQTSTYRVITTQKGKLVTAYPAMD